ncbi:hypothetical protein V8C26DRAFT_406016 [Trichoderma gracile]
MEKESLLNDDDDWVGGAGAREQVAGGGRFAVDGRGRVVWGGKAESADDVMPLDEGVKLLLL